MKFLIELRKRFLQTFSLFLALFVLCFYYSSYLFHWYIFPLQTQLKSKSHLIATQITTPLLTPLNMAIHTALLGTLPYFLIQIWCFSAPALYREERRTMMMVLISSLVLFLMGALFGYFFILPFMFQCILNALPAEVLFLPDMSSAFHFTTSMLMIFGISFQIPLVCMLLVKIKLIRYHQLISIRPYSIVGAFIVGMLLTPPDVVSQILLAVPLWGLYELGILLAWMVDKKSKNKYSIYLSRDR